MNGHLVPFVPCLCFQVTSTGQCTCECLVVAVLFALFSHKTSHVGCLLSMNLLFPLFFFFVFLFFYILIILYLSPPPPPSPPMLSVNKASWPFAKLVGGLFAHLLLRRMVVVVTVCVLVWCGVAL